MTTAFTPDFIKDYQPYVETLVGDSPAIREKLKAWKKEMKRRGFMIRTKWFSSLGSYGMRAIRYKHGEPTEEIKAEMKRWVAF